MNYLWSTVEQVEVARSSDAYILYTFNYEASLVLSCILIILFHACACAWTVFTSTIADVMPNWDEKGWGLATSYILIESQVRHWLRFQWYEHIIDCSVYMELASSPEATHQWWASWSSCIPAKICINKYSWPVYCPTEHARWLEMPRFTDEKWRQCGRQPFKRLI